MMMRPRSRPIRLLAVLLLAAVELGTAACATTASATTLTALGPWPPGTPDETAFLSVLKGFTATTGIQVNYIGTRALSQVLSSEVQQGQPPDVAVLPNPGELARYVRNGDVEPVDPALGDYLKKSYSSPWLPHFGTDKLYTVPVKATLKSIIWYDPTERSVAPRSWDELMGLSDDIRARGQAPWCIGMDAPPTSGFPGTDWIEDILLHQSGPDLYQSWAAGTVAWTRPEVKRAWTTWGQVVATPGSMRGGPTAALLTPFDVAGKTMFIRPPGCSLEHQASFAISSYLDITRARAKLSPGKDFDFFPFPDFGTVPGGAPLHEVAADLAAVFKHTDAAGQLMSYLAQEQGQSVWPKGGTGFSANKKVNVATVYPDPVSKKIAQTLTTTTETLCYDASDLMPAAMSSAFSRAATAYIADPAQLDTVLDGLDRVRAGVRPEEWLDVPCG